MSIENVVAFLTLTSLEIVLGIDNIVFLAILTGKLPPAQQPKARQIGLALAMLVRIVLLLAISWVMGLTTPLFELLDRGWSGRDLILLGGGLFLVGKSTIEIHEKTVPPHEHDQIQTKTQGFTAVIIQIVLLDIIFSLDSVITAVGMASEIAVMIAAVVAAVIVMMIFAGSVSRFVERNPTIQMLALSFLILVGVFLVAEGLGRHIERGYIYFAMAFSLAVELLNMRARRIVGKRTAP